MKKKGRPAAWRANPFLCLLPYLQLALLLVASSIAAEECPDNYTQIHSGFETSNRCPIALCCR